MDTQEINVKYDLGALSIFDSSQIEGDLDHTRLQQMAENNFRRIFNKLIAIKNNKEQENDQLEDELQIHEFGKNEFEIKVPEITTIVPRFKQLPSEKQLSRWERYAKQKGIQKKKRSRKVWDDTQQDYVPRWGAYSIKKNQKKAQAIMEVNQNQNPDLDPFQKQSLEKQLAKQKQKMNTMRNQAIREGVDLKAQSADQQQKVGKRSKKIQKQQKNGKLFGQKNSNNQSLSVAQRSTASMGKFDKKAHKEEKKMKVAQRKQVPQYQNVKSEKNRALELLAQVQNKNGMKSLKK